MQLASARPANPFFVNVIVVITFMNFTVTPLLPVSLQLASPPPAEAVQRESLYRLKGDMVANATKTVIEKTSVKTQIQVLVTRKEAPDVFDMEEDDTVEMGPVAGAGLDLRSSGVLSMFR